MPSWLAGKPESCDTISPSKSHHTTFVSGGIWSRQLTEVSAIVEHTHPALRLADATIEHLCDAGVLLRQADDSSYGGGLETRMGLALAEHALLGLILAMGAQHDD